MNLEMEEKHNNTKIYSCTYTGCKSVFNRPYRLTQHQLVHMNIKPFTCSQPNCTKAYTSKSHLDRHIKNSHKDIDKHKETEINLLYCCPKCLKKYSNRQNLKRHIKISHIEKNKPYSCDQCRVYFKKKHQLRAHMFIHNGIKSFRCPHCEKDFVTLYEKKKHLRNHKTYNCEHCDRQFYRWTELMTHKRVDHQSPEYICDNCGKVFKDRTQIVRHVKKHTPNAPVNIFFCPYPNCTRHYSRNSNLKQHIMSRHEHVTHDCPLCGSELSSKASLHQHIKCHARRDIISSQKMTLETGRKKRKDDNTVKENSALKLAGIFNKKTEIEATVPPHKESIEKNSESVKCDSI